MRGPGQPSPNPTDRASSSGRDSGGYDVLGELGTVSLLSGLTEQQLARVAGLARRVVLGRSQVLLRPAADRAVVLVVAGTVRLFRASASGRTVTLGRFGAGQTCDALLVNGELADASYLQSGGAGAVLYCVPPAAFRALARQLPALAERLIDLLAWEVAEAHEELEAFAFLDLPHRVVRAIGRIGKGRPASLTHADLAGDVAAQREDVTKALHELSRRKIVRLDRTAHSAEVLTEDW